MPTQEQINATNVELQIANDNYAALANKYNRYQEAFKTYANATPEQQERARWAMQNLLNSYNQLRLDMYAAEDRINQAQSAVNNLNTYVAPQSPSRGGWQRRRTVVPQNEFGWEWWFEQWGVRYSPDWATKVYPNWSVEFGESPIINWEGTNIATQPITFPAPQTVRQAAAEYNTFTPRFVNNNTWTITNPYTNFINPNLVAPYTPRPKRRMSWYWWTY